MQNPFEICALMSSQKPFDFHAGLVNKFVIHYDYDCENKPQVWKLYLHVFPSGHKLHWNILAYLTDLTVCYNQKAKYNQTKEIILQIMNDLCVAALFLQNEIQVWEKADQPLWEQLSSLQKVEWICSVKTRGYRSSIEWFFLYPTSSLTRITPQNCVLLISTYYICIWVNMTHVATDATDFKPLGYYSGFCVEVPWHLVQVVYIKQKDFRLFCSWVWLHRRWKA